MADELAKVGIHFDDLNRLKIVKMDDLKNSTDLKSESIDFVSNMGEFDDLLGSLSDLMENLAKQVEVEKLRAIGSRNALKSVEKQNQSDDEQLRALMVEKQSELERLKLQLQALEREESDQKEHMQQFLAP